MKRRLIPFSWLPASWGLRGESRQRAELEYYYDGIELREKLLDLEHDPDKKAIEEVEIKRAKGELNDQEYDKALTTAKGEPWVSILNTEYDPSDPQHGSLELDWNAKFIESLDEAGYAAPTEEEMVDQWLTDLCRNIATEQYGGVGLFDDMAEATRQAKSYDVNVDGNKEG